MSDYNNGQIWEMIWRLLHWIGMQEQEACMMKNDYIKLEEERDAIEAKLAKAVEALGMIANIELTFLEECRDIALATLAEIKG